jgi:hypothetical protein
VGITFDDGSATISTTEYWLASRSTTQTPQTTDCILEGWIAFGLLLAGDVYEWRVVEKINGTGPATVIRGRVAGAGSTTPGAPSIVIPPLVVGDGWEVGVKKISGTDRTIAWSLRTIS